MQEEKQRVMWYIGSLEKMLKMYFQENLSFCVFMKYLFIENEQCTLVDKWVQRSELSIALTLIKEFMVQWGR